MLVGLDHRLAEHLSELLNIDLGRDRRAPAGPDADAAIYRLYLRGREHIPPYSPSEFGSSVDLLKDVIERSPTWAEPYAAIATAYVTACTLGWLDPVSAYPIARRYAEHALVLDPALCEAHVASAIVAGEYDWDWARAEAAYKEALSVCPGSAWVHRSRARFLSTQGRFDEALAETGQAVDLDPTSALMVHGAAQRFYEARQYDRAVALARIAKRLDPLYPYTYATLGFALIEQGRSEHALEEFDRQIAIVGRTAAGEARRAYAASRAGDQHTTQLAAAEARALGTLGPDERVLLALAQDDADAAVTALAEAVANRAPPSIWLAVNPLYDPLRSREDFRRLLATVGLESRDGAR
jgi:tetratricopeptide (TPR) repeat protein